LQLKDLLDKSGIAYAILGRECYGDLARSPAKRELLLVLANEEKGKQLGRIRKDLLPRLKKMELSRVAGETSPISSVSPNLAELYSAGFVRIEKQLVGTIKEVSNYRLSANLFLFRDSKGNIMPATFFVCPRGYILSESQVDTRNSYDIPDSRICHDCHLEGDCKIHLKLVNILKLKSASGNP